MITVEGEGGDVKQIFVLDEDMAAQANGVGVKKGGDEEGGNTESVQESKAMTPCFLHTPNMTNKWNDFKPGANGNPENPNNDIPENKAQEEQQ